MRLLVIFMVSRMQRVVIILYINMWNNTFSRRSREKQNFDLAIIAVSYHSVNIYVLVMKQFVDSYLWSKTYLYCNHHVCSQYSDSPSKGLWVSDCCILSSEQFFSYIMAAIKYSPWTQVFVTFHFLLYISYKTTFFQKKQKNILKLSLGRFF